MERFVALGPSCHSRSLTRRYFHPSDLQAAMILFGITSPFVATSRLCGGISYKRTDGQIVGEPRINCPKPVSLVDFK